MDAPDFKYDGNLHIYRANARLKIRLEDLETALTEDVVLPDAVDAVDITRRGDNHLQIESTPAADDVGKYTPTALLKGKIDERNVIVEDGEATYETRRDRQEQAGWGSFQQDDEDIETTTTEYVTFSGWGEDFLVNDLLRNAMFDVLCQLTAVAFEGSLQAVLARDGELTPIRYEAGGEQTSVSLTITKDEADAQEHASMEW